MFFLDDLLLAPINGLHFIAKQIHEMAEKELNDESVIKQELLELQLRHELEEISEQEFAEREAQLFARLRAIKEQQLEVMQDIHTSGTSSMVVETSSAGDSDFWQADKKDAP